MHIDESTDFFASHWLRITRICQDHPPLQRCQLEPKLNGVLTALGLFPGHHQIPIRRVVCIGPSYNP
jgi:hypothetical protein